MKKLLYILILSVLFSCNNKKYEDEIAQLKSELANSQAFIEKSDSAMRLMTDLMDSIDVNQELINSDLASADTDQDSILARISGAQAFIELSRAKILYMETELKVQSERATNENKRANGLLATIRRLKKEIQVKEDSLLVLNDKVLSLEDENVRLTSTVRQQKQTIESQASEVTAQQEELAKQAELLKKKEEEVAHKEMLAKRQEADKFYNIAKGEEALGDKTKFAPKKKKEYYLKAEQYYEQAYNLGKTSAQEAMYAVKEKASKIKFAKKVGNE